MFGGGMRQSGHLAAAGIYALENNIERLTEDHARALHLATAVNELPGFSVNLEEVQTNMCYIQCDASATEVVAALAERDVQLFDTDLNTVRAVTHLDVDDADIDHAIAAFTAISG